MVGDWDMIPAAQLSMPISQLRQQLSRLVNAASVQRGQGPVQGGQRDLGTVGTVTPRQTTTNRYCAVVASPITTVITSRNSVRPRLALMGRFAFKSRWGR